MAKKYKSLLQLPPSNISLHAKRRSLKISSALPLVIKELTVALLITWGALSAFLVLKVGLIEAELAIKASDIHSSVRSSIEQRQQMIFFTLADGIRKSVALLRAEEQLAESYSTGAPLLDVQTAEWLCPDSLVRESLASRMPFFYALVRVGLSDTADSFTSIYTSEVQISTRNALQPYSECIKKTPLSAPSLGLSAFGNSTRYFEFIICVEEGYCRNAKMPTPLDRLLSGEDALLFRVEAFDSESIKMQRDSPIVWPFSAFSRTSNATEDGFAMQLWIDTRTINAANIYSSMGFYDTFGDFLLAMTAGLGLLIIAAGGLFIWQCAAVAHDLEAALENGGTAAVSQPFRKLQAAIHGTRTLCRIYRRHKQLETEEVCQLLCVLESFFTSPRKSRILLQELVEHLRILLTTRKTPESAFNTVIQIQRALKALATAGNEEVWWNEAHQAKVEGLSFEADILALKFLEKAGEAHRHLHLLNEIEKRYSERKEQSVVLRAMYLYYLMKSYAQGAQRRKFSETEQRFGRFLRGCLAPLPAREAEADALHYYAVKLRFFVAQTQLQRGNEAAAQWNLGLCLRDAIDPGRPFRKNYKKKLFGICNKMPTSGFKELGFVNQRAVARLDLFYNSDLPRRLFALFHAPPRALFGLFKAELLLKAFLERMTPQDTLRAANGLSDKQFEVISGPRSRAWEGWWNAMAPRGGLKEPSRRRYGLLMADFVKKSLRNAKNYLIVLGYSPEMVRGISILDEAHEGLISICHIDTGISAQQRKSLAEAYPAFLRVLIVDLAMPESVDEDFYRDCLYALL